MPTPEHLRALPPGIFDGLTDAEAAELAREGLGLASGSGPCLGFDVATVARARLGIDEAAAFAALATLAEHELATVQGEVGPGATVTLHPESRSWF